MNYGLHAHGDDDVQDNNNNNICGKKIIHFIAAMHYVNLPSFLFTLGMTCKFNTVLHFHIRIHSNELDSWQLTSEFATTKKSNNFELNSKQQVVVFFSFSFYRYSVLKKFARPITINSLVGWKEGGRERANPSDLHYEVAKCVCVCVRTLSIAQCQVRITRERAEQLLFL